ncbi:hypothetical protein [Aquimarina sp. SS2-1]
MLNNILKFDGVHQLDKNKQKQINGGSLNSCFPYLPEGGCFSGPEHCNI